MATKEMTHLGTYVVPKVNLLPAEIGMKRAQQRSYVAMGVIVVAAVGAVGFLYTAQVSRVSKATQELKAVQSEQTTLNAQRQDLVYVDAIYATVDANEALLRQAVERRIKWSRNLHDLGLRLPESVWLQQISIAQNMNAGPAGGAAGTKVLPDAGLGTVTFTGRAFTHNDVASALDALAKIKAYGNPYFMVSELKVPTPEGRLAGDRNYVDWSGKVVLTPAALQKPKSVNK